MERRECAAFSGPRRAMTAKVSVFGTGRQGSRGGPWGQRVSATSRTLDVMSFCYDFYFPSTCLLPFYLPQLNSTFTKEQ